MRFNRVGGRFYRSEHGERYSKNNFSGICVYAKIAFGYPENDPCPCGSGKKYKDCCGKN